MTIKEVVKLLKRHKPRTPGDIEHIIPLKYLGKGCYREVCAVKGSRVVIKFPFDTVSDVAHARNEMQAIERLLTSPKLRKHAPKVYHFDWDTGVIVMKRYQNPYTAGFKLAEKLSNFFETAPDFEDYVGNFAKDGKTLIAIDLGIT